MSLIRVLYILPALNFCGGMENYAMNYYRRIDKDKVQIDFITHTNLELSFKNEIESLGGKVYQFPVFSIKNFKLIQKKINEFFIFHKNEYSIIHCHMANAAYFYFRVAKKYGINIRILHSHQPSAADKITHKIRNYPLLYLGNKLATHRVACTELAGKFLFKNKPFIIIKNAIDAKKFNFNYNIRAELRKKLNLENKFVIGHIGRFCAQKNQKFLLEIFKEVLKKNKNAYLILIGDGEDKQKIKECIKKLNLMNKVKIIPPCENVNDYYQAFDTFVFPSLYEGLGIVLIEAQCAGLMVYTGNENIPKDVKVTSNLQFISLKESANIWADDILNNTNYIRKNHYEEIKKSGYDIDNEVKILENYYLSLINKS